MSMSWVFGSGKAKKKRQYAPLQQEPSDGELSEEGEEHVIFRNPGDLELNLVPKPKVAKSSHRSKWYNVAVCLLIGLVLLCVFSVTAVLVKIHLGASKQEVPQNDGKLGQVTNTKIGKRPPVTNGSTSDEWQIKFEKTGGEGGLALLDVDGDGISDIIVPTMPALSMDAIDTNSSKFKAMYGYCAKKGLEYPCAGEVIAVKGTNGQVLWRLRIRSEGFLTRCDIDINKDGRMDCVLTGRQGTAVAIDPYTPKVIWTVEDDRFVMSNWNMYRALILHDWDKDGVPELLLTNGGDPAKDASDHNRTSGRLIVVSGATGKPLGTRYLAMNNNKETYMSPVIYQPTESSAEYVMFGSGGETVNGDLMAMSVYDLCLYVMDGEGDTMCTNSGEKMVWPDKQPDEHGIITIISGERKGMMVPPVIVDVDKDGIRDLVVSVYDGAIVLISGKTLNVVWKVEFPNMESYSSPAPGYFDDDDTLDFMVHWCIGAWEEYAGSTTYIISGASGKIIWSLFAPFYQMTSDLIVNKQSVTQDLYLFQMLGRGSNFRWDLDGLITRGNGTVRNRRHGHPVKNPDESSSRYDSDTIDAARHDYAQHHITCEDDLSHYKGEVFLMDRTMVMDPLVLMEIPMIKMVYNATRVHRKTEKEQDEQTDKEIKEMGGMSDDGESPPLRENQQNGENALPEGVENPDSDSEEVPPYEENSDDGDVDTHWQQDDEDLLDDGDDSVEDDDVEDDDVEDDDKYPNNEGKFGSNDDNQTDHYGDDTNDEDNAAIQNSELDTVNQTVDNEGGSSPMNTGHKPFGRWSGLKSVKNRRKRNGEHSPRLRRHNEDEHSKPVDEQQALQRCAVGSFDTRTTGVIGDVDGDGNLDYISLLNMEFSLVDEAYSFDREVLQTYIYKVNLEANYMKGTLQHVSVDAKTSLSSTRASASVSGKDGKLFLPLQDQKWTKYLPNDNVYPG